MATARKCFVLLVALGMLALLAAPALAGSMSGGTVTGDGTGTATATTVEYNNDEQPGQNPNSVIVNLTVNGLGPIYKNFDYHSPTGGVTEYLVTENITNGMNTFVITDYHLDLGWRFGQPAGAFTPSVALDGLDFDWGLLGPSNTPPPTATKLLKIVNNVSEDNLDYYSTGPADVVLPGQQFRITYSVDVPDYAGLPVPTQLVIRQWATPEPGTLVLLITAGIGLLLFAWRRRK